MRDGDPRKRAPSATFGHKACALLVLLAASAGFVYTVVWPLVVLAR